MHALVQRRDDHRCGHVGMLRCKWLHSPWSLVSLGVSLVYPMGFLLFRFWPVSFWFSENRARAYFCISFGYLQCVLVQLRLLFVCPPRCLNLVLEGN
jgi:hypothetical protein